MVGIDVTPTTCGADADEDHGYPDGGKPWSSSVAIDRGDPGWDGLLSNLAYLPATRGGLTATQTLFDSCHGPTWTRAANDLGLVSGLNNWSVTCGHPEIRRRHPSSARFS